MDEDTVIETIREYLESQFPKECQRCGAVFKSLSEYIKNTYEIGDPVSFDADEDELELEDPLGTYIFANCKCGSTLALTSGNMDLLTLSRLRKWVRVEATNRGATVKELLRHFRSEVRRRALNEFNDA